MSNNVTGTSSSDSANPTRKVNSELKIKNNNNKDLINKILQDFLFENLAKGEEPKVSSSEKSTSKSGITSPNITKGKQTLINIVKAIMAFFMEKMSKLSITTDVKSKPISDATATTKTKSAPVVNAIDTTKVKSAPVVKATDTTKAKSAPVVNATATTDDKTKTASNATKTVAINGGGPNTSILSNKTDKPMTISVLTNDAKKPQLVTLQPGETVNLSMPSGWAGRINKSNNDDANPQATLGEIKFDGSGGQMFYDASVIDGYNGGMTMKPTNAKTTGNNSPLIAGSSKDITADAPESMKKTTSNGEIILDGVAPVGDYATKKANQEYYLKSLGEGTAYTYPKDDVASTRTAVDNSINIDFY